MTDTLVETKPRRSGKLTEYQNGHYFLYVTEWDASEDGAGRKHVEIEIYYAKARPVWHTTDPWKLKAAKSLFDKNPTAFDMECPDGLAILLARTLQQDSPWQNLA